MSHGNRDRLKVLAVARGRRRGRELRARIDRGDGGCDDGCAMPTEGSRMLVPANQAVIGGHQFGRGAPFARTFCEKARHGLAILFHRLSGGGRAGIDPRTIELTLAKPRPGPFKKDRMWERKRCRHGESVARDPASPPPECATALPLRLLVGYLRLHRQFKQLHERARVARGHDLGVVIEIAEDVARRRRR
jgi:hypothetical protein